MSAQRKTKRRLQRSYEEMGKYLRKLRKEKGLTQRSVSDALGYSSAQFISNFERGTASPPLKKLKVLMELYGADRGRLIELSLIAEKRFLGSALGDRD